jgi:hypothetical protein
MGRGFTGSLSQGPRFARAPYNLKLDGGKPSCRTRYGRMRLPPPEAIPTGKGDVYACGDGGSMSKSVEDALTKPLREVKGDWSGGAGGCPPLGFPPSQPGPQNLRTYHSRGLLSNLVALSLEIIDYSVYSEKRHIPTLHVNSRSIQ